MSSLELDLEKVLLSGQTFRWQRDGEGWWISPMSSSATMRLKQEANTLYAETRGIDAEGAVTDYFHLSISLAALRDEWKKNGEEDLVASIDALPGLRIVRQDPVECLFSFLCSSAAPIHRIRKGVDGMCRLLGDDLGEWADVRLFAFPELTSLASVPRAELDHLGLGFRGRYIKAAAVAVLERGGRSWLDGLRDESYEAAKESLVSLPGVGEKVADCVCLFSLNKHHAVPIDVHMARVARRQFPECQDFASVTPKSYAVASECFRRRYGWAAGWAQQYFFYAEIERRGLWDQELGRHRPKLG